MLQDTNYRTGYACDFKELVPLAEGEHCKIAGGTVQKGGLSNISV